MFAAKRVLLLILVVLSTLVVFLLAIFPPSTRRVFQNQRRAVQSIRDINVAEHNYVVRYPDTGFACKLSDLGEHGSEPDEVGLLDKVLASGTKSYYHFEIQCITSGDQKATNYTITALPVAPGKTGTYALCSDQSGKIWYSENGSAPDCLSMRKLIERKYE